MLKDTTFMQGLQGKVAQIIAICEDKDTCRALQALAEELLYSDPVGSEALAEAEADLAAAIDELHAAVVDEELPVVIQLCARSSALLSERNRLCKQNKK